MPSGSYLLEVLSLQHVYSPIRIDISGKGGSLQVKATKITDKSAQMTYPLRIEPDSNVDYFIQREGFNLSQFTSSPMLIMVGTSLFMILVIPKLMANIDQDTLREMQGNPQDPPPKFVATPLPIQ